MKAEEIISEMTGKDNIMLVDRGNSAIKIALQTAKNQGYDLVLIPDQGGWLTYRQFPKKLGLKCEEIKTDYGLINADSLKEKKGILLYQSLAGYYAEQDIAKIRKNFQGIIILDVCNLGDKAEFDADILIGSFGKDKVVDLGYGGFIASDLPISSISNDEHKFDNSYSETLVQKLMSARKRLKYLYHKNRKVKEELKEFEVMHALRKGINAIVKFNNPEEKEKLINYCAKKNYEYTLCPRYIRVNADAVSIELKRLKTENDSA